MIHTITIPYSRYPETCEHITFAWKNGHPKILTYDSYRRKLNRRQSLKGYPCISGFDRDEYPLACTCEGGAGADIAYISPSDNRGAGAYIGAQLRIKNIKPGDQFIIYITD